MTKGEIFFKRNEILEIKKIYTDSCYKSFFNWKRKTFKQQSLGLSQLIKLSFNCSNSDLWWKDQTAAVGAPQDV